MSTLTQFMPSVNAQIGELKVILKSNLYVTQNSTTQSMNVLTDSDGGVWLRTGRTYNRADYPQLANTIGVFGGANYIRSGSFDNGDTCGTVYQVTYAPGPNEYRLVTSNGRLYGNSTSGYYVQGRNYDQAGWNLWDICHNSEGTGLPGNTWVIAGALGIYYNDMSYTYDTGRYYDSNDYRIVQRGCTYGNTFFITVGNWGRTYWSQGGGFTIYTHPSHPGSGLPSYYINPTFNGATGRHDTTDPQNYTAHSTRYGANLFVVLSQDMGAVSFSSNGNNWPGLGGYYDWWANLTDTKYANGVWVACGFGDIQYAADTANGTMGTSTNGFHWRKIRSSTVATMRRLAWGANVWVACGDNGNIIYSTVSTANVWSNAAVANIAQGYVYYDIDYSPNCNGVMMFASGGQSGVLSITQNANATSVNANNWLYTTENTSSETIFSMRWVQNSNVWVYGTSGGRIATSTDGRTWIIRGTVIPSAQITRAEVANGLYVIGTNSGQIYYTRDNNLNISNPAPLTGTPGSVGGSANNLLPQDRLGLTWAGYPGTSNVIRSIAYSNSSNAPNVMYVSVGDGGSHITTSPDGVFWNRDTFHLSKTNQNMKGVAFGDTAPIHKWIAVGDAGHIKTSQNAFNWSGQQNPGTANIMYGIAYGQNATGSNVYVTGGAAGNLSISDDGIYWRGVNATTSLINAVYYANGLFFYGTNGGGLASSPDGERWSDASNTTAELNSVAYGNNIFVVVGNGGIIRRSNNGVYWETANSNSVQNLLHVEYGGGLFLAVGGTGNVLTSTDGVDWRRRQANALSQNTFYACAYGATQSLYVYGGQSGNIATSTDGNTWIGRTSGTTSEIRAIAANSSLFVYATLSGGLASSTDGITWTSRTSGTTNSFYSALFANGVWVVAGQNGNLITSVDGTTWTARTSNTASIIYTLGYDSNTKLYFYGAGGGGYATSTDAITWTANTQVTATNIFGAAFGSGLGASNANLSVICGSTGFIRHSRNAQKYSGSNTATVPRTFAYGNGVYLMAGDSGVVRTSTDGLMWTAQTTGTANAYYASIYANNKFLVLGNSGNSSYSIDNGITWTFVNIQTNNLMYSVAYGNNIFVRGGQTGNVGTSTDGITWVASNVTTVNAFSNLIYSIVFNSVSNTFFYVGANHRAGISTDGNNWSYVNPYANTTNPGTGFAAVYGNNEIVVVGNGGIPIKSRTSNANNWSTPKTNVNFFGITHGGNVWVAAGSNGNVRTSTDGVYWSIEDANARFTNPRNWTGIGNTANVHFARYYNNLYLIGGQFGNFKYSTDGYNWTSADVPRNVDINDVTYGQGKYVVVGNTHYVATSTDLITWQETPYLERANSGIAGLNSVWFARKPNLVSVVYNPTTNTFALSGETRTYYTSTDAYRWNERNSGDTRIKATNDQINTLIIGDNGKFVYGAQSSMFATSTNGIRWGGTHLTGNVGFQNVTAIVYDANNRLWCISNGDNFSTSTDLWHWDRSPNRTPIYGETWQQPLNRTVSLSYGPTTMLYGNNTMSNGNSIVAVGTQYSHFLFSHTGGRSWNSTRFSDRLDEQFGFRPIQKMAVGKAANGITMFCGVGPSGRIAGSYDGFHWFPIESPVPNYVTLRNVSYGNDLWTIVGNYGHILFTRDFISWQRAIDTEQSAGQNWDYHACLSSPNVHSVFAPSGAGTIYSFTHKNDPRRMIVEHRGFDEDSEFYVPIIRVSGNNASNISQGGAYGVDRFVVNAQYQNVETTFTNSMANSAQLLVYIKAK